MTQTAFRLQKEYTGDRLGYKHHLNALTLGVLAAGIVMDSGVTLLKHRTETADAHMTRFSNDESDQSIFVIPGCSTKGSHLVKKFEPQLSQFGSTNYLSYPTLGFSFSSIENSLLKAREAERDKPATIYALSLGGMVMSKLLSDPAFRRDFGTIDRIILDSAPASEADVRRSAHLGMGAAALLHTSWSATKIAGRTVYRSSQTPLHVVSSQTKFIRHTHLEKGSLKDVADQVFYVQSEYDSVIDTDQAHRSYEDIFDAPVNKIIAKRPHGSHADGPGYQDEILDLVDGNSRTLPLAA